MALEYARAGSDLELAGRRPEALEELAARIRAETGREARTLYFDAREMEGHDAFVAVLDPLPDGVVCLVGELGQPPHEVADAATVRNLLDTNFVGLATVLNALARRFERRGSGFIVGVSSVAGDRGRASNYIYGSAKAGLTAYLSGLRARLHPAGVHVLTVKPGFVRTRMTAGLRLPPLLTATPEEVARRIVRAQRAGREVIYHRRAWRPIMACIRALPEALFKRLRW